MAEPNAATVEVPEEGIVTVDVSDDPSLATVGAEPPEPVVEVVEAEPKPAKTPKAPKSNAADEAAAALTQAVGKAETERKAREAAEATAMAERRGREEAQRVAEQRTQEAAGYREQAESRELTIINTGIETATREIAAYQAEMERALEAGEFPKVSAAQVKLSKATAALDRLEDAKANFEVNAKRAPTTEGAVTAPQVSAFEQYVSTFTPPAQAWLRAHPECVPAQFGGDQTKNAKMMAGHYDAVAKGYQMNSPEYFQTIEEHAGYRTPVSAAAAVTPAAEPAEPTPKPKPRVAQPSAPVSRDPPTSNGQRTTRTLTLNKDQQEAAKISFPQNQGETEQAWKQRAFGTYARNFVELESEGKLGRLTH